MASGPANHAPTIGGLWAPAPDDWSVPLVVIVGINGRQGTSVANAFLNGGGFRVRGLTSSPECASSNQWRARGVDIRFESYTDTKQLHANFEGATIIFASCSVRRPLKDPKVNLVHAVGMARNQSPQEFAREAEKHRGRMICNAAANVPEITQFVFSTLPVLVVENSRFAPGIPAAEHLAQNGHVTYIQKDLPELWSKTILVRPSPCMEDYHSMLKMNQDGSLTWGTTAPPNAALYWLNMSDDFGALIRNLTIALPFHSFSCAAFSDRATGEQVCAIISKVSGRVCNYKQYSSKDMDKTQRDFLSDILPLPIGQKLYDDKIFTPAPLQGYFERYNMTFQPTSFVQYLEKVLPRHLDALQGKTNDNPNPIIPANYDLLVADTHVEVILGECQKAWNRIEEATMDERTTEDHHPRSAADLSDIMYEGPFMGIGAKETYEECVELFDPEKSDFSNLRAE